jgi:hypothetical protein
MNNGLVLFPAQSFVENKGFDSEGTNCGPGGNGALMSQPTSLFKVEVFPPAVQCSEAEYEAVKKYLFYISASRGLLTKIFDRIVRVSSKFNLKF